MALIVETGSGNPNANSYVSVAFADDYFASHPYYADNWADLTTPQKESLLSSASRNLDMMVNWRGTPTTTSQGLRWPRRDAANLDGIPYPSNMIPLALKQAVCEYAYFMSTPQGNPDTPSETEGVTELKVDVIQLKFGTSEARKTVPTATIRLLAGLGYAYSAARVRKVQVTL